MRHKLTLSAAIATVIALAVLTFGSSLASGTRGDEDHSFQLKAHEDQSNFLDLGDSGPSLGDQIIFADTLSRDNHTVGEDGGNCTVVRVAPADTLTANCVASLSLRRGQITVQGLVTFRGETDTTPFTVAVTGGTGAYSGVGGEMDIQPVNATDEIYTLHLDFP